MPLTSNRPVRRRPTEFDTGEFVDKGGAVLNARAYGTLGDGVTDDTAALQAWLNDVVALGRGAGFLPDGDYVHDGTLRMAALGQRDHQLDFGPNAYLCPTAGNGLLLEQTHRVVLNGPKVRRLAGSTATAGIRLDSSVWVTINTPVVWAYDDPSTFIPVDVDNHSYWCDVNGLTCERVAGAGLFPAVVRFRQESNSGTVRNCAIGHFADGVRVDGSNGVRVTSNAFEGGTYGIHTVPTTGTGNIVGLIISHNRFEAVVKDLKVDAYLAPYVLQIFGNFHATADPIDNTIGARILTDVRGGVLISLGEKIVFAHTDDMTLEPDGGGGGIIHTRAYLTLNADDNVDGTGDIRLQAGGVNKIIVGPAGVGFHGIAASARQNIVGSRGGNAALADLLTKLAAVGLITDATS